MGKADFSIRCHKVDLLYCSDSIGGNCTLFHLSLGCVTIGHFEGSGESSNSDDAARPKNHGDGREDDVVKFGVMTLGDIARSVQLVDRHAGEAHIRPRCLWSLQSRLSERRLDDGQTRRTAALIYLRPDHGAQRPSRSSVNRRCCFEQRHTRSICLLLRPYRRLIPCRSTEY